MSKPPIIIKNAIFPAPRLKTAGTDAEEPTNVIMKCDTGDDKLARKKMIAGTLGGYGAGLVGSQLLAVPLMIADPTDAPTNLGRRLYDKYAPRTGVTLGNTEDYMSSIKPKIMRKIYEIMGLETMPFYDPTSNKVYNVHGASKSISGDIPAVIGHELGHSVNRKALGKAYTNIYGPLRSLSPLALPLGIAGYLALRDKDDKKAKASMLAGLGVSSAGAIASMADEAIASRHSVNMLRSLTSEPPILRSAKRYLGLAWSNQALLYGLPIAVAGGLYLRNRKNRKGDSPEAVKTAGTDAEEPQRIDHESSPYQQMRPRSEIIIYNEDGILGIKKDDYLLMPGGGIPDGETPENSAVREALEEADAIVKNMEKYDVIESIFDPDNIISPGWDGERTHFFMALYGGEGRMNHPDKEAFKFIPFNEAIAFLNDLIKDPKQEWALQNNITRRAAIMKARAAASNPAALKFKKYAAFMRKYKHSRRKKRVYTDDYIRRYS